MLIGWGRQIRIVVQGSSVEQPLQFRACFVEQASGEPLGGFLVLAAQFPNAHGEEWLIFFQPSQQALGPFDLFVQGNHVTLPWQSTPTFSVTDSHLSASRKVNTGF